MTSPGGLPLTCRPRLSLVIPVYNEAESLWALHSQLRAALRNEQYEVIFVDDGSTDVSGVVLESLLAQDARVRVVRFARNFGKAEALAAGFCESRGAVVITLDADLQDDPAEIPKLLEVLEQGYDLVSGWKQPRRDPWTKLLPSRLFNWATATLSGLPLHDFNSGLKAYRRRVVEELRVYGEQHRYIPALAYWKGFRVAEVAVAHRPRQYGRSKFGPKRFLSGFLDLLAVLFLTRFQRKPLHLFGSVGLLSLVAGVAINLYLTWLRLQGEIIGTRPLLQLGVLLMVTGVQFLSLGLLGEMITLSSAQDHREGRVYEVVESPLRASDATDGAWEEMVTPLGAGSGQ